eukprot:2180578-Rhodomonas_salina.2
MHTTNRAKESTARKSQKTMATQFRCATRESQPSTFPNVSSVRTRVSRRTLVTNGSALSKKETVSCGWQFEKKCQHWTSQTTKLGLYQRTSLATEHGEVHDLHHQSQILDSQIERQDLQPCCCIANYFTRELLLLLLVFESPRRLPQPDGGDELDLQRCWHENYALYYIRHPPTRASTGTSERVLAVTLSSTRLPKGVAHCRLLRSSL